MRYTARAGGPGAAHREAYPIFRPRQLRGWRVPPPGRLMRAEILDLGFGAVRADIDLGGIPLTRLEIETGASQTVMDISEPNSETMSRASMDVGAAEFIVRNLGNLNTRVIDIDAGIGEIDFGFTGEWRQDARVSVDMGLGSLVLRFPRGLGVQLVKDTFLTSLDSEGLVKRGDSYYSLDYEEADYQITVDIDAAFGSIRVTWVD